jgi:lysophospholipase L1-like esterase
MQIQAWLTRLLLVLLGLLLAMLLLEIGLRVTTLFFGGRTAGTVGPGYHTILTLGDSHTYGVGCSAEDSYPGQLQAELERRKSGKYRVINLGLPGMNSSQIKSRLVEWTQQYHPEIIVLCVGVNNSWNVSVGEDEEKESWIRRALWSSRLFRLVSILALRLECQESPDSSANRPEIARQRGREPGTQMYRDENTGELLIEHRRTTSSGVTRSRAVTRLRKDLKWIYKFTATGSVRLILLTYAAFPSPGDEHRFTLQTAVSNTIVKFANHHSITIIDPRDRFRRLLRAGDPRSRYYLNEHDGHPNARGYREIAALVAAVIEPDSSNGDPGSALED